VCLHNNLHVSGTVAALESGRHVYCEKPMAGAYADAVTMLETAKRVGRRLHIQLAGCTTIPRARPES
jgi:predicted dehydrogenase